MVSEHVASKNLADTSLIVQRPACSQLGHVLAQLLTFRATLVVSIYAVSAVFLSKMYYTINGSQYASILYRDRYVDNRCIRFLISVY
jgi:hypothetical protein